MKKHLTKIVLAAALTMTVPAISSAGTYTYATTVDWVTVGTNATNPDRSNPANALVDDDTFLSLGLGGAAVFSFGVNFLDTSLVVETTWGDRDDWLEYADIYVSSSASSYDFTDATVWTFADSIDNSLESTEISLPFGTWTYLAVVDKSTDYLNRKMDGFDIDAVGVNPVPEPATMALFGLGIAGLVGKVRRRK